MYILTIIFKNGRSGSSALSFNTLEEAQEQMLCNVNNDNRKTLEDYPEDDEIEIYQSVDELPDNYSASTDDYDYYINFAQKVS